MFGHNDDHKDDEAKTVEPANKNDLPTVADPEPKLESKTDLPTATAGDSSSALPSLGNDDFSLPTDSASSDKSASKPKNKSNKPVDNELLDLKRNALEELAPLVDQLDQTPLEHFKTTMMMIQATDDSSLIKSAYESAKKITEEKERAQALLDIVNEINYFTQQHNSN